jgi:hypothetical protein
MGRQGAEPLGWFVLVLLVAIVATLPSVAAAQPRAASNPCVVNTSGARGSVEPTLEPVDEAPRRPDFLEFRRRLEDAVSRRDESAVLAIVDPNVRISFGDGNGIEAFRKEHLGNRDSNFWEEFATILRLGGRFRMEDAFDAPYTFSTWPADLDSFECLAVVGTRVRVRAAPGLSAPILTTLDFAIIRALPTAGAATPGWRRIQLADGRIGYMSSQFVRSPIARRALFQLQDGRWRLMAYVAGD